jgi:transcriptional regulator with XRE-family HTH domain
MDDARFGSVVRTLRRRARLRQLDVAHRAGVAQSTVSRLERGHHEHLSLATVRRVLAALDARVELQPRWRGGEIDRLLDERHSALAARVATELDRLGWLTIAELSFSVYGERGSIDLVAYRRPVDPAVMIEVKTSINSIEELLRRADVKARLLPDLLEQRLDWRPRSVARILVVEDDRTNRRRIAEHRSLVAGAFPGSTVATRRWLRSPADGPPPGVWFLSAMPRRVPRQGVHRVARPDQ